MLTPLRAIALLGTTLLFSFLFAPWVRFAEIVADPVKVRVDTDRLFAFLGGCLLLPGLKWGFGRMARGAGDGKRTEIYGLEHGRLHLKEPAMWMNMGYWKLDDEHENEYSDDEEHEDRPTKATSSNSPSKTMAEACRDLLQEVLKTAGLSRKRDSSEYLKKGTRKTICLIDLGFGCGEQTMWLTSAIPISKTDEEWWGTLRDCPYWDAYVGITLDERQYWYAEERVRDPLLTVKRKRAYAPFGRPYNDAFGRPHVAPKLFCGNAANPQKWSNQLKTGVENAIESTQEHWVLALDTAYHFSPSRWPIIDHTCHSLDASFMGFDLCISPTASLNQRLLLRILTTLMGAPWANFVTPDEYRRKLVKLGYQEELITIRDISEDVFGPLATFLEAQDQRLHVLGYGLGAFNIARKMFKWWATSGVVRGIIVVARKVP